MKSKIFSLLFVAFLCVHLANCDLRFVFSMFRHGARAPTAVRGGVDDFGEKWSNLGELTPAGKRMQFLLGLRNRQVYKDFTTRQRIDGSVFIRSTDYNRTIESVQAQMQGFFPPGTGELIADKKTRDLAHPFIDDPRNSGWKAYNKFMKLRAIYRRVTTVPIHLFTDKDPFNNFFYHPFNCKAYRRMIGENQNSERILGFKKRFREKYGERFLNMTGHKSEYLDDYWALFGMFDAFISDVYDGRNLTRPQQYGFDLDDFNRTAFEFAENDILWHFNGDKEQFFPRWSVSILWPEVIQWMEARIAADQAGNMEYGGYKLPRFAFFSTHDVTVGSGLHILQRAFGFKLYYTPFASDIFFELHNNHNGEYRVVVKYQSLTLGTVPFAEFKQKLEAQFMTREQIQEQCQFHNLPDMFLHPESGH